MTDFSDVDAKLAEYGDAFDFYMENGKLPSSLPADDCLAGYMSQVIDNNPQIDGSDPVWVEVLKDDLMAFFSALLEQFRAMQAEATKELALIKRFREADIEQKRAMWQEVCRTIESGYSAFEVNLPGYTSQFRSGDKDAVFSALTGDWENACLRKLDRRERRMLSQDKTRFEQTCREAGSQDYEEKKKVEKFVGRFPQLKEIVDLIGRDKDPSKEEKDAVVSRFLPTSVAKNSSVEEIDRVESGNNLERVLPVELSMPEDLFYKRYATKDLQQFSSPGKDKPRKQEEQRNAPRLTKGPVVVSIDTSGSMEGQPLRIAFALLKQLVRLTKKQKRPCFLISFSIRAMSIDLANPRNRGSIDSFLEQRFSGGTDGEQMLAEAIRVLQKGTYEMADVLIISDFEFAKPRPEKMEKIHNEKALGTRFYGLKIGQYGEKAYDKILDKIWTL